MRWCLVPEYNDPMDATALEIVQGLYPIAHRRGHQLSKHAAVGGHGPLCDAAATCWHQPPSPWQGSRPPLPPWDGIEWLDLMGRKVSSLQPGQMYIQRDQNGRTKKVIGLE